MRRTLTLVKNGVPFDVAFGMDKIMRAAFYIIFEELDGHKFDWDKMKFVNPARARE